MTVLNFKGQVLSISDKVSAKGKNYVKITCIDPNYNKIYITSFSDKQYKKGDKIDIPVSVKYNNGFLNFVEFSFDNGN